MPDASYLGVVCLMPLVFLGCHASPDQVPKKEPIVDKINQFTESSVQPNPTHTKQQSEAATGAHAVPGSYKSGYVSDSGYSSDASSSSSTPCWVSSSDNDDVYNRLIFTSKSDKNQPAGLKNLGNTCFMNASLQIIAALYPDKSENFPTESKNLQNVIQAINGDFQAVDIELLKQFRNSSSLKDNLAKDDIPRLARMTTSNEQECAQEFLEALNEQYPFLEPWEVVEKSDKLPILSLIPTKQDVIQDLSDWGTAGGFGQLNSVAAGAATRLAIHLGRNINGNKITTNVTGTKSICVRKSKQASSSASEFELGGFIVHSGSAGGGHYIAYVKKGDTWYCANDDNVTKETEATAIQKSGEAYLLFYTRSK